MAASTDSRPDTVLRRAAGRLRRWAGLGTGFGLLAQASAGLMFLTRLRVPIRGPWPDDALARAAWSFPLAGALVGGLGAGAALSARWLGQSGPVAALAALTATMLVTGALHEDGLADAVDGLGGGRTVARKLEIMKDSRIGSYGALALLLSVGMRGACVVTLLGQGAWAVAGGLIAAHAVARAGLPTLMRALVPVRPGGLGAMAGAPAAGIALVATLFGLAIALVGLGFWRGLFASLLAVAAMAGVAMLARRQIGGYTGDILGAAEQAAEIAVLLAAAAN
jgi:adenosylcobinamide-GDP ribazoletransferase